jgi:hypothetical protein
MDLQTEDRGIILFVHKSAIFERCINDLRHQGDMASLAAKRVDKMISSLANLKNRLARRSSVLPGRENTGSTTARR